MMNNDNEAGNFILSKDTTIYHCEFKIHQPFFID